MKQVFLRLLAPLCIVALGAGCQKSGTPARPADAGGDKPSGAPTGQTASAQPGAQAPAAPGPPGTTVPPGLAGAPGGLPTGQPGEAPVKPVPAVLPAVVATVNGEDIQKWEVEAALKQAEASAGGPVPADKRDAVLRNILDELVTYHLLAQEANGRKMNVPDADVDAEMLKIRQDFPTEDAYKQALLLQGVTVDQLRALTRRAMQAQKLVDAEVTSKIAVADAEVDTFYKENIDRFKQGDTVHVSHIYLAVPPNAPPAEKNQKRAAATELLKQVRAGADFAKIARENSNDATAANGGDLGFFGKGDMPPDFEKVAFELKPGTMSGVVELQTGLHIIKVHERRGPRTAPLAEVRENVKAFLLNGQRQTKLDQLLGQIKGKSTIQILV
jgi:peptidyl-prolyl cis-trans isomerase C